MQLKGICFWPPSSLRLAKTYILYLNPNKSRLNKLNLNKLIKLTLRSYQSKKRRPYAEFAMTSLNVEVQQNVDMFFAGLALLKLWK